MNQEIIDYIKKSKKITWLKWYGVGDQEIIAELLEKNYSKEDIYSSYKYLIEQEGYRVFLDGIFLYSTHLFVSKKRQLKMIENILYAKLWSEKEQNMLILFLILLILIIVITGIFTGTLGEILFN